MFRGSDVDQAGAALSGLFSEVEIQPLIAGRSFPVRINGVQLAQSGIACTEIENGLVGGPTHSIDFHTIQFACIGATEIQIGKDAVTADSDHGVVVSSGKQPKFHIPPGGRTLDYVVPDVVLRESASAWLGETRSSAIEFQPRLELRRPSIASLVSILHTFIAELDRPGGVLEHPVALANFEQTLINLMLFGLEHDLSETLDNRPSSASVKYVREVEDYIDANATKPIDIADIARVTGHSTSSIFRAFRKYRNHTPMQHLAQVRMRLVRERLLDADPSQSVTQIAFECGFSHLGRFAAEYRRRFKENPSQTIKRAKPNGVKAKHEA
jgi:AraC-like DNA-binding protein